MVCTLSNLDLLSEFWYEVLFIDFGNGQNSNYTELRPMPNILQRFPMMAQQCFLAEIEQPNQYLDSGRDFKMTDLALELDP